MENENNDEHRIIKVLGDGEERNWEKERYREFHCFGRKNVEDVCGNCKLRFTCLTTREEIEIPVADFGKASIRQVTVKMVVERFTNLRCKFKKGDRPRAQINFNKVVTKDDL